MQSLQRHVQVRSVMERFSFHLYSMQSVFVRVSAEVMLFSIS